MQIAPVKGMRAFKTDRLVFLNYSIVFDREWALVDMESKVLLNETTCPQLKEFEVSLDA